MLKVFFKICIIFYEQLRKKLEFFFFFLPSARLSVDNLVSEKNEIIRISAMCQCN